METKIRIKYKGKEANTTFLLGNDDCIVEKTMDFINLKTNTSETKED